MTIKLTQTVTKGGCAAKVPAFILREILSGVKFPPRIPGVSIDGASFDDAGIYEINQDCALVQTLDFFTPILDSPHLFGAVAAANALSDVYAMGGRPKTCMAILAAPYSTIGEGVISRVIQGACEIIEQASASLVGGHTIDDDTLKFGLSVTGIVHPKKIWANSGARVGDDLILTKPLGTGAICAGLKRQIYDESEMSESISSMIRINNIIDFLDQDLIQSIHAATDITGFGLAGHAMQLAKESRVRLNINVNQLPLFQTTKYCLEQGFLTKAHRSNEEYTRNSVVFSQDLDAIQRLICFDPQTSGGLLLSVQSGSGDKILNQLKGHFPGCALIGKVIDSNEESISFHG